MKVQSELTSMDIHTAFIAESCGEGKKWKNLYKRILRTLWGRKKNGKIYIKEFQSLRTLWGRKKIEKFI